MSTRIETYLIYGVSLAKKQYDFLCSLCDDADVEHGLNFPWCGKGARDKFGVLSDHMSDDYCVAGKCLAVQDDEFNDSFGCMEIPNKGGLDFKELADWVKENNLIHLVISEPKLFLINHVH